MDKELDQINQMILKSGGEGHMVSSALIKLVFYVGKIGNKLFHSRSRISTLEAKLTDAQARIASLEDALAEMEPSE